MSHISKMTSLPGARSAPTFRFRNQTRSARWRRLLSWISTEHYPPTSTPHYHHGEDPDCVMVGHRCNCPQCQELSPTTKRTREAAPFNQLDAVAIAVPPPQKVSAPAADIQTVDSFNPNLRVPGSPPTLGLVASENRRTAMETVDDRADAPAPASIENAASRAAAGQRTPMSKKGGL